MADHSEYLAIDLEVLSCKGFKYFSNSIEWPVSEDEFHKFSDYVRDSYDRIIHDLDDSILSEIALVEVKFVNHLIDVLHYNYVKEYCIINSIRLDSGVQSNAFFNPDWDAIGCYYSNKSNSYGKIVGFIRNLAKNIFFNRHLSFSEHIKGIIFGGTSIGIGSNDRIKQEYIKKNRIYCDNRDVLELIDSAWKNNKYSDDKVFFSNSVFERVIRPFFDKVISKGGMFVSGVDFDFVKRAWIKRFNDAHRIYRGLSLDFVHSPNMLLVTEVGKPYSKLITLAFQRMGCKVFNFHHGNDSLIVNQKWVYQSLMSHCDNYVVETRVMKSRFNELMSKQRGFNGRAIKYISIDSQYYSELRKKKKRGDNGSVMLMGYPMNPRRHLDDSYLFFHYKLSLEYMLSDILSEYGYKVNYKIHPDRIKEAKNFMGNISSNIIEERFEDVWQDAGVLIFTYVPTTTFCYALNLPIPIVLIDIPETPWYKDMRNIVEKRVAILPVSVSGGKFDIDKHSLLSSIDEAYDKVCQDVSIEITG